MTRAKGGGARGGSIARILVATLSVSLTVVAAEMVVRVLPKQRRFLSAAELWRAQQDPGDSTAEYDDLSAAGVTFRDVAPPADAYRSGATRLLFLGDSFTVGAGLARRQDRFSERVEASLAGDQPASVFIFNGARGGTNPDQWAQYLRTLTPVVQPHAVVAVFFLRDGTLLGTSLHLNRKDLAPILAKTRERPLYGRSELLSFFWDRLAWREYTQLFVQKMRRSYLGSHSERAMWRRQQEALIEMAARCRADSVGFHLVIFPLLFELDRYAFHDVEAEIEQFAERNSIPVFSLTPAFLGQRDHELWVASNNQHPNARGHRIAADRLLPYVRDHVLAGEAVK